MGPVVPLGDDGVGGCTGPSHPPGRSGVLLGRTGGCDRAAPGCRCRAKARSMSLPRRTLSMATPDASTPGAPTDRPSGRHRLHPHPRGYGMVDADYPVEGLPTPDPSYGAERVVGIQLDALGSNDDPIPDAGINTAYNFASPANRRQTGPLDRFVRIGTTVRADDRPRRGRPRTARTGRPASPTDRHAYPTRRPDGHLRVRRLEAVRRSVRRLLAHRPRPRRMRRRTSRRRPATEAAA